MARPTEINLGVIVHFSELFNRAPTIEGAQSILAQFNRNSVLLTLAKVSAALQLWFLPDYSKDNGLACDVFTNAPRLVRQRLPGDPPRLFFTRLGALATARLALASCDENKGLLIEQPAQAAQILGCCLMMNELVVGAELITGVTDLLVHQLPIHNASVRYDLRGDLLRSMEFFERNQELLGERTGMVALSEEFVRATGLPPRKFVELCLVVGAPYRAITAASLIADDPAFYIDKNRFSNIMVSTEEVSAFFRTVARTSQELAEFLTTRGPRPFSDTTVFQSWPFIRVADEDRYYCLDVAGLMDKTGRGLYWTLFASADGSTKARLGGTYGVAFETYLHDRVGRAGLANDQYLPNPLFPNGDEACDAVFCEGSNLVFCEYKSSVLRADAKLSGSYEQLESELDKKFIAGDKGGRKGISQLARSIARFLQGEGIAGLPNRKWTMVLPALICLEPAMLCPGMSGYLNQRFDRASLKALSSTKIAPLTLIDVEHFEDLLPDFKQYGFATLLDDYYRTHVRRMKEQDQLVAFRRRNIPFLDGRPASADIKEEAFRRFLADLGSGLFGVV